MRTFVAIELSESCRRKLVGAIESVRADASGVRWVNAESAHLTLKFIGELSESDLPAAVSALAAAAAASKPFRFRVAGVSGFPPRGKPRVIHAPVLEPTGALASLADGVEQGLLRAIGLPREGRPFTAHITLGRVRNPRGCPTVEELAGAVKDADFGEVAVESLVLMKSDLTPRGAIHTLLHRFPLGS